MGKLSITGGKPVRTKPFSDWPIYSRQEERALQKVLASRNWGGYPFPNTIADRFAQKFAKFHGAKYGLAVSNGTVAIQVALKAAGIGPGDEVIVPAYTWEGTVGPVLLLNAVRAPPRHLHGDPASLAPHERLLTSPSYLVRNRTLEPPLENNPEIPPSSRDEGLRLLHGLATNLATSLQTP